MSSIREKLADGNRRYIEKSDAALRQDTAENGQHPWAIVVCCSDSRVIPEQIFDAGLGELFVIRVAGNVLDDHQLGSIEYAAEHLHCGYVVVLGHTGCGAVAAALHGDGGGFIRTITDVIRKAAGNERDPDRVCRMNVEFAVKRLRTEFSAHPATCESVTCEPVTCEPVIEGAVYDIGSGKVEWL